MAASSPASDSNPRFFKTSSSDIFPNTQTLSTLQIRYGLSSDTMHIVVRLCHMVELVKHCMGWVNCGVVVGGGVLYWRDHL